MPKFLKQKQREIHINKNGQKDFERDRGERGAKAVNHKDGDGQEKEGRNGEQRQIGSLLRFVKCAQFLFHPVAREDVFRLLGQETYRLSVGFLLLFYHRRSKM